MLDTAFEALKQLDWGTDLNAVTPIDDAVADAHGKPDARNDLEKRLITALQSGLSRDAREYVCRKLAVIGSAVSVPQLSTLLVDADSSHMARFALESMTAPEACQALREALPKANGNVKIGIISSLGSCRDAGAVASLGALLKDENPAIARAAALALGAIGTTDAAAVLQSAIQAPNPVVSSIVDAILSCAESLLAGNKRSDATAIYKKFADESQPRIVRLAATRGLLACASRQA